MAQAINGNNECKCRKEKAMNALKISPKKH